MDALVHQHATAVKRPRAAPGCAVVITLRAQVGDAEQPGDERPQRASLDSGAHPLECGVCTPLQAYAKPHAGAAAGGDHRIRVGERERHRLFNQHVLAGARRRQRLLPMQAAGRRDAEHIHIGPSQQCVQVALTRHAEL